MRSAEPRLGYVDARARDAASCLAAAQLAAERLSAGGGGLRREHVPRGTHLVNAIDQLQVRCLLNQRAAADIVRLPSEQKEAAEALVPREPKARAAAAAEQQQLEANSLESRRSSTLFCTPLACA